MANKAKTVLKLEFDCKVEFERAVGVKTCASVKLTLAACREVIDQIDTYESLDELQKQVTSTVLYNIKTCSLAKNRTELKEYILSDLNDVIGVNGQDVWFIRDIEIYEDAPEMLIRPLTATTGVEVMEHVFRDAWFVYTYKTKTRRDFSSVSDKAKTYELMTLFVEDVIKRTPTGIKARELEIKMQQKAASFGFNLELMAILAE